MMWLRKLFFSMWLRFFSLFASTQISVTLSLHREPFGRITEGNNLIYLFSKKKKNSFHILDSNCLQVEQKSQSAGIKVVKAVAAYGNILTGGEKNPGTYQLFKCATTFKRKVVWPKICHLTIAAAIFFSFFFALAWPIAILSLFHYYHEMDELFSFLLSICSSSDSPELFTVISNVYTE